MDIVDLRNLKVYFYDQKDKRFIRAVEDVGFTMKEGSILGMVGESGCGKSVTALSMMGLLVSEPGLIGGEFFFHPKRDDRKNIIGPLLRGCTRATPYRQGQLLNLFFGLDRFVSFRENPLTIIKDSEKWLRRYNRVMEHVRGKNISMIFQSPIQSLHPFLPVGIQLEKTVKRFNCGTDEAGVREKAANLMRSVQLREPETVFSQYPGSLSLGMAQRIVIAIALASNPRLVIADEPTSGLDTANKYRIIELLESVAAGKDTTLLLISHNIRIVEMIASHIMVMYAGIVVERGPRNEIIGRRKNVHPYTEALLSSLPDDTEIRKGKRPRVISGAVPDNKLIVQGCPFLDRCPYARGRIRRKCRSVRPPFFAVSENHEVRCYLFEK